MTKKVLVVDDEPQMGRAIGEFLSGAGYAVTVSDSFPDALEKAKKMLPDLILADVVMPESSGFEVCRRVKEALKPHPPKVILMTAKLSALDPVLAREMGADDFVVKTANMSAVLCAVKKILNPSQESGEIL